MKITEVPMASKVSGSARRKVLEYLRGHAEEVFRVRQSQEVAEAIGAPRRTVEHALWSLSREGLISKGELDGLIWYGSHEAIDELISVCPEAVHL